MAKSSAYYALCERTQRLELHLALKFYYVSNAWNDFYLHFRLKAREREKESCFVAQPHLEKPSSCIGKQCWLWSMLENIFGEISGSRFAPYLEKQEKVILKSINNVIMIFCLIIFWKKSQTQASAETFLQFSGKFLSKWSFITMTIARKRKTELKMKWRKITEPKSCEC